MSKELRALTAEQLKELERLSDQGDRTGVYVKYHEFTGSEEAIRFAKISSFSGFIGGIAKEINILLEKEIPQYPQCGVEKFSQDIQRAELAAMKKSFDDSKGGILTDFEMTKVAQKVWADEKVPGYFPGNTEIAIKTLLEKSLEHLGDAASQELLETALKNPGLQYGIRGTNMYVGKNIVEILEESQSQIFRNSPEHVKHITADLEVVFYTDKATGNTVYVEETGVKDNKIATPITKQELAFKLNIPEDWIKEDIDFYSTIVENRLNPVRSYTIMGEPMLRGYSKGDSNAYTVKEGDTVWGIAKQHGMTVEQILALKGNEYLKARIKDGNKDYINIRPGDKIAVNSKEHEQDGQTGSNVPESTTKPDAPTQKPEAYTVQERDTVWDIAKEHGVTVDQILGSEGNEYLQGRMKDGNKDYINIRPGDKINVPVSANMQKSEQDNNPEHERSKEPKHDETSTLIDDAIRSEKQATAEEAEDEAVARSASESVDETQAGDGDASADASSGQSNKAEVEVTYEAPDREKSDESRSSSESSSGSKRDASTGLTGETTEISSSDTETAADSDASESDAGESESEGGDTTGADTGSDTETDTASDSGGGDYGGSDSGSGDSGGGDSDGGDSGGGDSDGGDSDGGDSDGGDSGGGDSDGGDSGGGDSGGGDSGGSDSGGGDSDGGFDPVVIDLNNNGIRFIPRQESRARYDINSDGKRENVGWISGEDAFLAYDYNHDGKITETKEISFKLWDESAKTDLEGLVLYFDSNKDGYFNNKDATYEHFYLWQDVNENGLQEDGELNPLKKAGVKEISLQHFHDMRDGSQSGNRILQATNVSDFEDNVQTKAYDVVLEY